MKQLEERLARFRWHKLLGVWCVFLLMGAVLLAERSGVQYAGTHFKLELLPRGAAVTKAEALAAEPVASLVLYDSAQGGVDAAKEQWEVILQDMKIAAQWVDIAQGGEATWPSFADYRTVVVLMPNLSPIGTHLMELLDWVEAGGSALFGMTPVKTSAFDAAAPKLGILSAGWQYEVVEDIVPTEAFLLGGGQAYSFSDPFESALSVRLRDEATLWAASSTGVPLIWSNALGEGCVVVDNFGIYGKVVRGFYAASYSLLGDACAWPVINSAVFYLDDFPSPVPSGDGAYIRRDYGLSIADFYSRVWWPDLLRLAQRYGIRFTGVLIENYEDDTLSPPTRQKDTQPFRYYGGLLLRQGGELGYHGYNHQPLVLPDTDYKDEYAYHQWPSREALAAAMEELIGFAQAVLPYAQGSVYVPPSNILSAAGRQVLSAEVPAIRTVASTYFGDGTALPYVQEFGVAEDGIVEAPRIVSGSMVGDGYMRLAAVSELNLHFVSSHFMHPDDLLDPDRGAAEGWSVYKQGLEDYLAWLTAAAPALRMQTATESAGAIQRFSGVTVELSSAPNRWTLKLGNLTDEAWLLFRANHGTPGRVQGGELTHLTGSLYLLRADAATVQIERKEE